MAFCDSCGHEFSESEMDGHVCRECGGYPVDVPMGFDYNPSEIGGSDGETSRLERGQ